MKLSDLGIKEVVNLNTGARLGVLADSDLLIDEENGKILSLIVPDKSFSLNIFAAKRKAMEIPWDSIRKIGHDMIIIEME